ncbi:Uncharacterised protein [Candidatus Tiddalikarchaeum anstoanum]|nr:Uncharacterised protein [Candidatus Tiddalikarchaeum anstoanum]
MDSNFKLYLSRSENELNLAGIIFQLSINKELQLDIFKVKPDTYFSAAISHAYYCIFYAAKAYLLTKNVKTNPPEEHRKTFEEFKKLVDKGIIDKELLELYEDALIKADALLDIFQQEKGKRGKFTYRKLPQANQEPANESLEHAKTFFKHMYNLCEI